MKKRIAVWWLALLVLSSSVLAQDYKMTALYLLNFAKYVEWSPEQTPADFSIAVLGDDPVYDQIKTLAVSLLINEKKVAITKSLSLDNIAQCNILYISPDKSSQLTTALDKFTSAGSLIVCNKAGLGKAGAAINMVTIDGKIKYEINMETLKRGKIKAKPVLFKLGTVLESLYYRITGRSRVA